MANRTVMLSIDTTTDQEFVDQFERLSRLAAGLLLDDIECRVHSFLADDEDDQ